MKPTKLPKRSLRVSVPRISSTSEETEATLKGYCEKQLSGDELSALAEEMINAPTENEKNALIEKIIEGFYGRPSNRERGDP
jgi:hypothetical protein